MLWPAVLLGWVVAEAWVRRLWERLADLAAAAGVPSMRFRPPATEAALDAAEPIVGLALPESYRQTLLFAEGQDQEGGDPPQWIPGVDALRPIGDVVAQWRYETTLVDDPNSVPAEFEDSRFRWTVWHPRRIPIAGAYIWDYDNTYLDFIPGSTGTAGQVLTFTSEADMQVVGVSLSDALAKVIRLIERAQLTWDPNTGNLVPLTGAYAGHPADWFAEQP
jgi:cell wall assembly regulator SMI1